MTSNVSELVGFILQRLESHPLGSLVDPGQREEAAREVARVLIRTQLGLEISARIAATPRYEVPVCGSGMVDSNTTLLPENWKGHGNDHNKSRRR